MSRIKHSHALLFMLFCLMVATTLRFPDLPTAPPGVHYDEAANGVLAAEIGLKGKRPIFISSYTGKEVLFFYLAGGLMRLLGDSVFTLRFTSALVGLVTVAATYWLGMELFRDRRIALIATALLAISFWHLLLSRLGFRAITQPLLQALTVAAFLRGARQNQWRWFLISGSFLGLTGYTYLAARLFPLLLVTAVLPLLLNRQQLQRRWSQLGVFILTALALLAPLLVYFVLYPDAFWVRITQVAPGESGLNVSESFVKSLQMYFLLGDPYWRFNLPGRPLFDWFWGSLLVVGWVVLLVRWRKLEIDWQRTAFLFCILAPFIMILPTALATNEIVPSNLRAIGLIPFIFYLPAIGLMFFLADLEQRYQRPKLTSTILVVGLLALAAGGLFTERLYFRHWATLPEVYFESDGDLTAVAQFLDTYDTTDKTVYVAALHYQHPTLAFLSDKYGEVKWLPRSEAVVFPAKGTAVYFYPHNSPLPAWAVPYFQTANLLDNSDAPDGTPAFVAYENSQTPSLMVPNPVNINFDHAITLLGYDLDTGTVGEKMPITLYWRVERSQTADFTPFVHLEDVWQYRWSQVETFAYPGGQWTAGETIIQQIDLPIPPGTPPGTYRLRVGLFSGLSGEQLMRLDENGRYAGDAYFIEDVQLQVGRLAASLPQPLFVLEEQIRPQLRLLGYERGSDEVMMGDRLTFALWWLATESVPPATIRVELLRSNNTGRILTDTTPVHDTYPFPQWETPQFLIDRYAIRIPDSFTPGDYQITIRMLNAADETIATFSMGPVTIVATERIFTSPPVAFPHEATLGNEIKLLGYNLEPDSATGEYILSLIWQALTRPSRDYTVFIHLLQPDGSCNPCAWQQDSMPQQNQYPTSRWLADEIIVDTYHMRLPEEAQPGQYPIEVGLYIAETGQRLQVTIPDQEMHDAIYLPSIRKEK